MTLPATEFQTRSCDVVMKGGITSGVVYPTAVSKLAQHFRLRNIGGTSAGAIAAAAAAAAQFSAQRGNSGAFKELERLPDFLGRKNKTGFTNLFTYFQPQRTTKRLFDTLIGALEAKSASAAVLKVLFRALFLFPFAALLGLAPGAILLFLAASHQAGWLTFWSLIIGAGLALSGPMIAATGALIWRFGKAVPHNCFGFCSGMSSAIKDDNVNGASSGGQALTVWLTKYLNEIAGLNPDGPPLTFGQLWQPDIPAGSEASDRDAWVRLEMYTTCLSKGRPFRLPFRNNVNVRENVCYFREDDFRRLFPSVVVDWLTSHPRTHGVEQSIRDQGYLAMPDPWNLPVVVATRMSLSFPILLSAIPLFAFDYEMTAPADPRQEKISETREGDQKDQPLPSRCWFSDGGICSNFPIHFFDAPIPTWPTFGVNLVEARAGATAAELAQPWMPETNNQGIREPWTHFGEKGGISSLVAFIATIINTMQNWSDNTLSRMPGYRDRIANVELTAEEGGLNLQMPSERIGALSERGTNAASEFIRRFATTEEPLMNWPNHRWIRLRSMLGSVVEMAQAIDRTCANPQANDPAYDVWLRDTSVGDAPSYQWSNASQQTLAIETIAALRDIARKWTDGQIDAAAKAPRPRPELRPRPRT
jgi:predicted acylesterase/phospholipase RssA